MSKVDPTLQQWLQKYKLESCMSSIIEAGIEEYGVIEQLDEEMIQGIIEEANLNKSVMHRVMFKKGVSDVINGVYKYVILIPCHPNYLLNHRKLPKIPYGILTIHTQSMHFVTHYKTQPNITYDIISPFKKDEAKESETIPEKAEPILREMDNQIMDGKKTKTIIFIGESGCGKTTTINSMLNYLEDVSYDNSFRFRLPNDLRDDEFISKYHFRTLPVVDYALNIIDTQGFGDFVGVKQNDKMRQDYKDYLQSIAAIDGIYFVMKATETTMSSNQRLFKIIADLFVELFGDAVKDNISIIFTFSDGADPPALKTVEKLQIPYKKTYRINNSAFGENRTFVNEHMFSEGMGEFQQLFEDLEQFSTSVSAKLSPELLVLRDYIATWTSSMDIYLKPAMNQFYAFCETHQHLKKFRKQIEKDPNYNQIPHSYVELYTNPETNQVQSRPITTLFTREELATKYRVASGRCDDIMKVIQSIMDTLEQQILFTITSQSESLKKLYKLMADDNDKNQEQLTTAMYFDILIQLEFEERETGFRERIGIFTDLKTKSRKLGNNKMSVQEIMNLYVFWQQYFAQMRVNIAQQKYEKEKKEKIQIEAKLQDATVRHNKTLEEHRINTEQINKKMMTERFEAKLEMEKVKMEAQYGSGGGDEAEEKDAEGALVDKYVSYFGQHYPFEASIVTYYAAILSMISIAYASGEPPCDSSSDPELDLTEGCYKDTEWRNYCKKFEMELSVFTFMIFLLIPGLVEIYKYYVSKDANKKLKSLIGTVIAKEVILGILMLSVDIRPFNCCQTDFTRGIFRVLIVVVGIVCFILHGAMSNPEATEEELAEKIGTIEYTEAETTEVVVEDE